MRAISKRKRLLFGFALWLAFVSFMVQTVANHPTWSSTRFEIPLGISRALHVRVGSQSYAVYQGLRFDQLPQIQYRRSTRVHVWYQPAAGVSGQRLLTMPLPLWPAWVLLPVAGIILGTVAGAGMSERRRNAGAC